MNEQTQPTVSQSHYFNAKTKWGEKLKDASKYLISPTTSIIEAIKVIDKTGHQIALIVDAHKKLLGVVTDGDVRRYILTGKSLEGPVQEVMNQDPIVFIQGVSKELDIERFVYRKRIRHVPVINNDRQVIGIKSFELAFQGKDNLVFLMAGGLGKRLSPLTDHQPKPMLKVGDRPILETIIRRFSNQGFNRFSIAVNYKAEMIESHFADGTEFAANISFVREEKRLGTAGALTLLKDRPNAPIIVMNADVLTKINFERLLDFHNEHKSSATMCVKEFDFQVPYGVVRLEESRITGIDEKPTHSFFVNAGIYIIEPELIDLIPYNQYFDMPSFFNKLIDMGKTTSAFPIREYWTDIGHMEEYDKAQLNFSENFDD